MSESKFKYHTTIVIDSERKPNYWSLNNYYWAVENSDAEVVSETTEKIGAKLKGKKR